MGELCPRNQCADILRRRLAARTVQRPTSAGGSFPLTYLRTGPFPGRPTILVIPGGPGLGVSFTYAGLRRWARRHQIDLIMIEHRGVGLSRRDQAGTDLTADDMRLPLVVADIAAVLDAEGVHNAVVYGSSYGTYVAQGFAVEHPQRVSALLLDSAILSAQDHEAVRATTRARLLHGTGPDGAHPDDAGEDTAQVADQLRALVDDGTVTRSEADAVARIVYEFCGPTVLERLLTQVRRGTGDFAWRCIAALDSLDVTASRPYLMEFDLVGVIAFRELNYAPQPDGLPFDPGASYADAAQYFPTFDAEPYDLTAELPHLTMPVVVLSGERDLRTPRTIARQIVELTSQGHLVPLQGTGHSLLDTEPAVMRRILRLLSDRGPLAVATARTELEALIGRSHAVTVGTLVHLVMQISPFVSWLAARAHGGTRTQRHRS